MTRISVIYTLPELIEGEKNIYRVIFYLRTEIPLPDGSHHIEENPCYTVKIERPSEKAARRAVHTTAAWAEKKMAHLDSQSAREQAAEIIHDLLSEEEEPHPAKETTVNKKLITVNDMVLHKRATESAIQAKLEEFTRATMVEVDEVEITPIRSNRITVGYTVKLDISLPD